MKTASCKITNELYSSFQTYCQSQGRNINEVLTTLVEQTLSGKIKPRPSGFSGRIPLCPRCGWMLSLCFDNSNCYLVCLRCDFGAFLGSYHLPKKMEDWTKGKYKEVLGWE